MKTSFLLSHIGAFSLAALVTSVASAADQPPPRPAAVAASDPVLVTPSTGETTTWDEIKTMTFEQRADFLVGLRKLERKLDNQIAELNTKRATMKGNTADWDFAMKGLNDASAYLKSMSSEINETTVDLWDNQKEKVQRAWLSAQEAYDKVKTSTTQS